MGTLESGETQFVLGTEQATDVWTIAGEGVAVRHALVRVAAGRIEVEDLAGGTLVNGHPITGLVEAEYPASVQVGEVTLVVEQKGDAPSQAATLVQNPPQEGAPLGDLEVTVVTPRAATPVIAQKTFELNEAEALCKYTLVKEIARGGMGQIYFGEDPQLERQVAVKVSSISEGGEDPRFTKEAKVLALLAHPNIVPIHATGVDAQGRPFYSMKLVKGRSLQAVLNALKDGDAAAAKEHTQAALLTIFRKVCDAMAFAHAKGILHRNLKPEHIMVAEYGEVLVAGGDAQGDGNGPRQTLLECGGICSVHRGVPERPCDQRGGCGRMEAGQTVGGTQQGAGGGGHRVGGCGECIHCEGRPEGARGKRGAQKFGRYGSHVRPPDSGRPTLGRL